MSKDLSALAAKLFIQTNSVLSPTFYKCGWLVATRQILAEAGKSSNAPPTKLALVPFKKKNGKIDYKNKSVVDLSIICRISYDKRVTELRSVYSKGKNCLLQQNSEILKF